MNVYLMLRAGEIIITKLCQIEIYIYISLNENQQHIQIHATFLLLVSVSVLLTHFSVPPHFKSGHRFPHKIFEDCWRSLL